MRVKLFDFQNGALDELAQKIKSSHLLLENGDNQVISFSAPTGAGKTIIMTALFENIFYGSHDFNAEPDAIIIWLSDMPELNEQTKLKIINKSTKIKVKNLVNIDTTLDSEVLEKGKVYFLNTQKLGNDKLLTHKSDLRQFSIWETLTNTIKMQPNKVYLVIDEAHRGTLLNKSASKQAQSIMQKFIMGSEKDGLIPFPLIIGVTATPQRFQMLLNDTSSTVHKVTVKSEDVRSSGLLKDRIIIHYPENIVNADISMLKSALENWEQKRAAWESYCLKEKEQIVKPILVIQVEDGNDKVVTKTDLTACISTIESYIGRKLDSKEIVHTFNDKDNLQVNNDLEINKIEASRINDNEDINFVLFKMNLSTGWDCPRAEVMMSFRSAQDYTYIAQLLGRMVRTPLARRIESDNELNNVSLFLPYYAEETVNEVIKSLEDDEEGVPTEKGTHKNLITLKRNLDYLEIFDAMENLKTYRLNKVRKQNNLKRLINLSRNITLDGIDILLHRTILDKIIDEITSHIDTMRSNEEYKDELSKIKNFDLKSIAFEFNKNLYGDSTSSNVKTAELDINNLFYKSGKFIGDGLHLEYWQRNSERDHIEAKIEFILFVNNLDAMRKLSEFAEKEFLNVFNQYKLKISKLGEARRTEYDKLLLSSGTPVPIDWILPERIDFNINPKTSNKLNFHLFVDNDNEFKVNLENWEYELIQEELSNGIVAWLRNLDRKAWSLEIPYEKGGVTFSMFPDLVVVRQDEDNYIFDILEPHDPSRRDNFEKAVGLAKFAEKHWDVFGRIQLIRKYKGNDGKEHFHRLDMSNVIVRNAVRSVSDNITLDSIFERYSIVE
ncbi:type iii restriction enzyme, res subunit [Lysinibacillus fusiformis ZB2]|nr:type iii restriction enzyme, res subunit [Lysinibacillus fusiformis ZB2]